MSLAPGITKAGDGLDNIAWNILGQTYVPKAVSRGLLRLARDPSAGHVRAPSYPPDAG